MKDQTIVKGNTINKCPYSKENHNNSSRAGDQPVWPVLLLSLADEGWRCLVLDKLSIL